MSTKQLCCCDFSISSGENVPSVSMNVNVKWFYRNDLDGSCHWSYQAHDWHFDNFRWGFHSLIRSAFWSHGGSFHDIMVYDSSWVHRLYIDGSKSVDILIPYQLHKRWWLFKAVGLCPNYGKIVRAILQGNPNSYLAFDYPSRRHDQ
jgi:hypothetical protein